MLARHDIAVDPLLLHEDANVRPVGDLVLETKRVLGIGPAQLEDELVTLEAMSPQDRLDDLRRGLMLVDAAGAGHVQPREMCLDDEPVAAEILRRLRLREAGDAA